MRTSRAWLVAGLCGASALAFFPQIRGGGAGGDDTLVTTGWVGLLFLACAAAAAVFHRRVLAGVVITIVILGTNYFAVQHPPYFLLEEVVWGVTPPLLLALWHLANGHHKTSPLTWATAALWAGGFAVKYMATAKGWRI